ncbi:hypothetical protein WMF04_28305 [Sorangium sp. So ce260]|uniref:hypothetical protein n=1 Tax=Sorangium sp. So ce260 TaxID=3133291 RepID=UPI003F5EBEA2
MKEISEPGAETRRRAAGAAGGASPACTTVGETRPPRWRRWCALLPVLACACSLEGLSVEWDLSSGSGGDDGSLRIRVEAEDEARCELSGRFERVNDPSASGGEYVAAPEMVDVGCDAGDLVDCSFEVGRAGTYQIRVRVATGPDESVDNSFWVSVDGEPSEPEPGYRYDFSGAKFHEEYVRHSKDDSGALLKFPLDPGTHLVTFGCREDAAKLDWVELVRIGP